MIYCYGLSFIDYRPGRCRYLYCVLLAIFCTDIHSLNLSFTRYLSFWRARTIACSSKHLSNIKVTFTFKKQRPGNDLTPKPDRDRRRTISFIVAVYTYVPKVTCQQLHQLSINLAWDGTRSQRTFVMCSFLPSGMRTYVVSISSGTIIIQHRTVALREEDFVVFHNLILLGGLNRGNLWDT